ncbi:MAG: glycerate kinase [Dehalococcoidia bacterium]
MKILCMPQAFKGCLTAMEAAEAMARGVREALPGAAVDVLPMADGGDDTLEVLVRATGGRLLSGDVRGPGGRPVRARWGVLGDGETAVVEMAQASGLRLLSPQEMDPRTTSTYGTGQLILAALDEGYRRIIVGVGGSATVDGGTGAAQALGARFLDREGRTLPPGGAALARLASIDLRGLDAGVTEAKITVACDVDIPLCGQQGAWRFAAQKGATPEVMRELEAALERFGLVVAESLGVDLRSMPLAGPAGGLSGGLHAFAGARLAPGADLVLDLTGAGRRIPQADLVVTGEGTLDSGSFTGKGPAVVATKAREAGVPVIAVVGQLGDDLPDLAEQGIHTVEALVDHADGPQEALARARELVPRVTAAALRRFLASSALRYN